MNLRWLLALLLFSLTSNALAVSATDGGVTFPVVADFTDTDGTQYSTEVSITTDTDSPVYLRFQWLPVDGSGFDYTVAHNPVSRSSPYMFPLQYVANWRGQTTTGLGALRVLPVDENGTLLAHVHLSGHGRLYVGKPDGRRVSAAFNGVTDSALPGIAVTPLRSKDISFWLLRMPSRTQLHYFMVTNLDTQPRTYLVDVGGGGDPKSGRTVPRVTIEPNRSALIPQEPLPDSAFENQGFDSLTVLTQATGQAQCIECGEGSPFLATVVALDAKSADLLIAADIALDQ